MDPYYSHPTKLLAPSPYLSSTASAHVSCALLLQSPFLADLTKTECVRYLLQLKYTNSTVCLIWALLVEVVVDLQQLRATLSLLLIFFFGFAALFFSCHALFPLHQALQIHSSHQLPLLWQLGGHLLLFTAGRGCCVSCTLLAPSIGPFSAVGVFLSNSFASK